MASEAGEDSALPKAESNEQQDDNDQRQASPVIPKESSSEKNKDLARKKIDVLLKATGDAPIMKKKKWAVDRNKQVSYLIDFIRKYIKCDSSESLFLYVNQTFVPSPDQLISNLYECFGTDGKLVLHYCKTQAWG